MSPVLFGLVAGLAFGIVVVALMVPHHAARRAMIDHADDFWHCPRDHAAIGRRGELSGQVGGT